LINYDFHFGTNLASSNDIESLYQMGTQNAIWCDPKLTRQHISPNNFERMKLNLLHKYWVTLFQLA
jgi:hypothetical protein